MIRYADCMNDSHHGFPVGEVELVVSVGLASCYFIGSGHETFHGDVSTLVEPHVVLGLCSLALELAGGFGDSLLGCESGSVSLA